MVHLGMYVCVCMYVFVYLFIEFLWNLHHAWNVRGSHSEAERYVCYMNILMCKSRIQ